MSVDRAARVANGSRRKRDLAAIGVATAQAGLGAPSATRQRIESWIAQNLPGEDYHAVSAVRFRLKKQGQPITASSVLEGLKERGWAKEQR